LGNIFKFKCFIFLPKVELIFLILAKRSIYCPYFCQKQYWLSLFLPKAVLIVFIFEKK